MKTFRITWAKHSYSRVDAKSEKEAMAKTELNKDYDWEDPSDTYYNVDDNLGWCPESAEEEED